MAILLLKKANKDENLFEAIILYASIIDAILRNLIAIKTGQPMTDGGLELDPCFFYHDEKKWYTEREIYNKALEVGVIDETESRQIHEMYNFRNRVVHRFILSGITCDDIVSKLNLYERVYRNLLAKLHKIDPSGNSTKEEEFETYKMICKKLGGDKTCEAFWKATATSLPVSTPEAPAP